MLINFFFVAVSMATTVLLHFMFSKDTTRFSATATRFAVAAMQPHMYSRQNNSKIPVSIAEYAT